MELAIPFTLLRAREAEQLELTLSLRQGPEVLERYPAQGAFVLTASSAEMETHAWSV
jgi:hypothetical protein